VKKMLFFSSFNCNAFLKCQTKNKLEKNTGTKTATKIETQTLNQPVPVSNKPFSFDVVPVLVSKTRKGTGFPVINV
jgi:hypothetical protein